MPETLEEADTVRPEARASVQEELVHVTTLMRKHRLVEGLVREQLGHPPSGAHAELAESAVYKKSKAALQRKLDRLHPADIAYILEALPLDERLYIWDLVRASRDGEILLEVSDAVRESLISSMDTEELVAATGTLEADEIADLAPDLPQEVMDDVFQSLPVEEREQLRAAMSFDDDMVGALMDFEDIAVRPDVTLEVVLRYLRRFDELPSQTDQVFVVDRDERLYIWDRVRASRDGDILLEVSDAVRESLISSMDTEELVAATETLETDEIAELAPDLPQEVMDDVFKSLPIEER